MFRHVCLTLLWMYSAAGISVHAEALSLGAALILAEQQSPDLVSQTADVDAARSLSKSAGTLPTPRLAMGIENMPVSGVDQWSLGRDFMTMRKIGLMQELPNSKKRSAQIDVATAAIERTEAQRHAQRLNVRRDTAIAWLNRYYLERRLQLLDDLEHENQLFADNVQALLGSGKAMPADAVAPRQEAAEIADRRDALNANIAKAKAGLRRFIGMAADVELTSEAPVFPVNTDELREHVHEHADLQVYTPMLAIAQAEVREAQAMKRPDWEVEVSYGKRGAAFADMVSAQVTIGLPLFSDTRIEPQIAAKRQAVTRITAERDAMLREHTETLEAEIADYSAVTRQLTRARDIKLLLAQQKVDLQFSSYQANKADLSAVLEARRELINERLKLIELEANQAALAAKLYYAYGEGAQ